MDSEPEALDRLRSIVADPKRLPRRKEWIGGQQYSYVLLEEVEAIVDDACRAAMLQTQPICTCPSGNGSLSWPCPEHPLNSPAHSGLRPGQSGASPAQDGNSPAQSPIDHGYRPECECSGCKATARICAELAGNSPALSPSREHFIALCNEFWNWSEMDMIFADDKGYEPRIEWNGQSFTHPVTRGLWRMYQAANTGIPMNSNGWIPVSERMPETDGNYWGWWSESKRHGPVWFIKSELQAQFQSHEITHWMPLPAAPQEVSDA